MGRILFAREGSGHTRWRLGFCSFISKWRHSSGHKSPVLFAVMVINYLFQSWGARIKFVDLSSDLAVLEVVPRNSPSLLNVVVDDILAFAVNSNMRLNPRKCKTMTVDFLHYNSCVPRPIAVGGSDIEQVYSTFKLLGVHLSEDLIWAVHCDYMVEKANRRLYALRQLKKCKVSSADIVHIYRALIRSILEYASAVFAGLPKYLVCILRTCKKGPFPSFGLVFRMKQHLTKLHYPLILTVGQSRVLNLYVRFGQVTHYTH